VVIDFEKEKLEPMNNNLMKRTAVFFAMIFFAACAGAFAAEPQKNIIIISWDGVQRNHLNELLDAGKLPNLAALAKEGTMIPIDVTTHQTDTKAGHTQMLSGYKPETTGVYNNAKYGPIPKGDSIFERLETGFEPENIVTIALTGKSHHIGSLGPGKRKEGKKKKAMQRPAEPWFNAKASLDVWDGDKQRDADVVGPLALGYLQQYAAKPFFFFLHFSDPDHNGHRFGENSDNYSNAIITCDEWLGKLRVKLAELGIADKTLIYVNADHGFDEGMRMHKNAPYVFLATNDKGITAKSGDQMDIVPTVLKREGLDPASFQPPLPGKPLF
jgi:predicted AlkP superfamily pyrophosphatase or phosphodiesterase